MEKRSGVPETDEALAGLTDAELDREIWAAKQLEPHLGPLPQKGNRFKQPGFYFASHETVNHAKDEYVRYGDPIITTNTVEGYFSVFKRGMKGIYQHCAEKHLHRYLAEFDFRYSERSALGVDDTERATTALKGFAGKRLTYRRPNETPSHV